MKAKLLSASVAMALAMTATAASAVDFHGYFRSGVGVSNDGGFVITSYSIHYTKLYELAKRNAHAVGGQHLIRRHLQVMVADVALGPIQIEVGVVGQVHRGEGIRGVITSYSIHYTKLYEFRRPAGNKDPAADFPGRHCGQRPL